MLGDPHRELLLSAQILQFLNDHTAKDKCVFLSNVVLVITKPLIIHGIYANLDMQFLVKLVTISSPCSWLVEHCKRDRVLRYGSTTPEPRSSIPPRPVCCLIVLETVKTSRLATGRPTCPQTACSSLRMCRSLRQDQRDETPVHPSRRARTGLDFAFLLSLIHFGDNVPNAMFPDVLSTV